MRMVRILTFCLVLFAGSIVHGETRDQYCENLYAVAKEAETLLYNKDGILNNSEKFEEAQALFHDIFRPYKECGISFLHEGEFSGTSIPTLLIHYLNLLNANGKNAEGIEELKAIKRGVQDNPAAADIDRSRLVNGVNLFLIQEYFDLGRIGKAHELYDETRQEFFDSNRPIYTFEEVNDAELEEFLDRIFKELLTRVYTATKRPDVLAYIESNW